MSVQTKLREADRLSVDILSIAKWVGTSAGLTGLVLVLGRLVAAGAADLLGVTELGYESADYLRVAGRFLIELLREFIALSADLLTGHVRSWPVLLVSLGVVVLASFSLVLLTRGATTRMTGWFRARPLIPLIALSFLKIVWFDVPAAAIGDVLLQKIDCAKVWRAPAVVAAMTETLWVDMVCSRAAIKPPIDAGACHCGAAADHEAELRQIFVAGTSSALLLASCFALIGLRRNPNSRGVAILLLAMAVGHLLVVPYSFGKLRYPTRFDTGVVAWGEDSAVGLVLTVGSNFVTVFDTGRMSVVSIPRSKVTRLELNGTNDAFRVRLDPSAPAPP